ncbi:hypothetical protein [Nocardia mexicana]|uniref:Uncharacterized protein n=1 Tax=Nocardia mexicana TaxID=279262 RepID=A0A370H695_9NOCA|nr:hypothetical protein [Nocardia mexicana]RDI49681.1 hypothetical protein DFR68_106116 [Nocardia mexicana]
MGQTTRDNDRGHRYRCGERPAPTVGGAPAEQPPAAIASPARHRRDLPRPTSEQP